MCQPRALRLGCALWVIGYCSLNAYDLAPEEVATLLGFPDWVFWGVVTPWMVANGFTFWFCLRALKNDEDEDSEDDDFARSPISSPTLNPKS